MEKKDHCHLLGLPYIHENWQHQAKHVLVPVYSVSYIQEQELFLMVIAFFVLFCIHLLAHRNIIMKFAYWLQPTWLTTQQILYLSCFLNVGETMDSYIEQSKTQSLGTWATEIEIIAAASLLQTTIYVYGPCGKMNKWHT